MQIVKKLNVIAVIVLGILIVSSVQLMAQEKGTYVVKSGDTLYNISKRLDVTIAELQKWNNLSGNEIELGQELVYYLPDEDLTQAEDLPAEPSDPLISRSSTIQNTYYIVKSGDTLYEIARLHNMTVEQLRALNNISGSTLRIGQKLAVKQKVSSAAPSVAQFSEESSLQGVFSIYEVKQGEKIEDLLSKFKMTENEFAHLNPELQLDLLSEGQEVTVLLPPSRHYPNPYKQKANLQDLGQVQVVQYKNSEVGETTTNGELYDPEALTAAHSNIALGSIIFVENQASGNGVYVRVNDRITGSELKLSQKAFSTLRLGQSPQPAVTIYTEVNE